MLDARSSRRWGVEWGTSFRRELQREAPLIHRASCIVGCAARSRSHNLSMNVLNLLL